MQEFLSIGEVAKLKGISVKALRYYEKIGIFCPTYINDETGYRYYSMQQMVILDFILTCLELGIPLKQFASYSDENGSLNIDKIVKDGSEMVNQEIARITRTADKLKYISKHLEETDNLPKIQSQFEQFSPERCFLSEPMKNVVPTPKDYVMAMTRLFERSESKKYTSLYKQGLLYQRKNDELSAYACSEIVKPASENQIIVLPAGNYICVCHTPAENQNRFARIKEFLSQKSEFRYILFLERYGRHFSEEPFWEVQMLK
ncbi:MAG: MerR family transcriptional regulator [Oscillospiraceae bacterium]